MELEPPKRRQRQFGGGESAILWASTVPTIVPVTRQNSAFRANGSQLAGVEKWKNEKDLRGKSKMSERRISVWQTAAFRRWVETVSSSMPLP